jgi:hypothetical protein
MVTRGLPPRTSPNDSPGMAEESVPLKIREEFLIKKWDGDPPAFEGEKTPVEVRKIVYENGVLISSEILKNGAN